MIQQILDDEDEPSTSSRGRSTPTQMSSKPDAATSKTGTKLTMVDVLSEEIQPLLAIVENVANLVLISMVSDGDYDYLVVTDWTQHTWASEEYLVCILHTRAYRIIELSASL